jgi:hypothetical protein
MQEKAEDITGLLTSWRAGDRTALDRLRSYTGLRDATSRGSARTIPCSRELGAVQE